MTRKLFVISAIILVIILLAMVGYYFFAKSGGQDGGGTSIFSGLFPFGGEDTSTTTEQIRPPVEEKKPTTSYTQKLRKISSEPVAGAGIADFKAGTVLRYIEKATGHIYEVELFSPSITRISNTTIPMAYEATWGNKNNSLIARYLGDDNRSIKTYSVNIKNTATSTANNISVVQFVPNISDYAVFGNSVFYLEQYLNSSIGIISDFNNGNKKQIWSSPIKEVLPQYVNANTVALVTKPYQGIYGFMFFVNTSNGQIKQVLGNIVGLSAIANPTADAVLAISQGNGIQMFLYDIKSGSSKAMSPITFPEKCVWSRGDKNTLYCAVPNDSLDSESMTSWYMGMVNFGDDIWKYDLKNNTASIVGKLYEESGELIDVIKPILSENEHYLVFINKTDGSLWSLDLTK